MASPAHCFYCFESLAASYEGNEPISLAAVEELWERYEQFAKVSELQDNADDISGEQSVIGGEESIEGGQSTSRPQRIKLPSIDRLQAQASPDSSTSTPSGVSSKSSSSIFSSVTTSSSISSVSETPESRQRRPSDQKYPLFVTWNTLSKSGRKSLRGCIGTFEAQELSHGLKSYALTSAFDDTRFSPIPASLLPSLSCSLTLLGTFEPCTNPLDWTLGTHGLRISFIHRGRRFGATYLPDVPVEQGWTKEETVTSLMHKAGWSGASSESSSTSAAKRLLRGGSSSSHSHNSQSGSTSKPKPWDLVSDFRTVKYQGLKASADYGEWQKWREWVLSLDDGSEALLST
ncbi:AMMECR1 domain-containing protein [Aspergillus undulatus]|uniref:AMMECR1 domain-containing protein n=1 Tax=Aspergillus undulatus TaxID=1810928 RepID=UPI003CCD6CDF